MNGTDSSAGKNPEDGKERVLHRDGDISAIRSGIREEVREIVTHGGLEQSVTVESPGENFHVTFCVKDLVEKARAYPVQDLDVADLLWCLEQRTQDPEQDRIRAHKADLRHPIIVFSNDDGDIINMGDGTHRVQKAHELGIATIKAHVIPKADMAEFAVGGPSLP